MSTIYEYFFAVPNYIWVIVLVFIAVAFLSLLYNFYVRFTSAKFQEKVW